MNPEAVQWLESLDVDEHARHFKPELCSPGSLASLKPDHESCIFCHPARMYGELLVIE